MKKTCLLLLVFVVIQAKAQLDYASIPAGSFVALTDGLHDSWAEWSPDNKTIYSLMATGKGAVNVFSLHLDSVTYAPTEIKKYYVAVYPRPDSYKQISFFEQGYVYDPVCSPDGKKLAFHFSHEKTCVMELDLATGKTDTLIGTEVQGFTYTGTAELMYIPKNAGDTQVYRLDTKTKQHTPVLQDTAKAMGIICRDDEIFLTYADHVRILDRIGLKEKQELSLAFNGTRFGRVDEKTFAITSTSPNGPAAALYDSKSKKTKLLMNAYDYEPTVSYDKKALAFVSEGVPAIIVYKLK